MIKLYNSLTRSKEDFKTKKDDAVAIYVCGITPNNATHLGHAFTYVSFDVLVRYLKYKNYEVNYLQNATDINDSDDVLKQAEQDGRTWQEEAQHWIDHFHKQMDALHVQRPTTYVLASSVTEKIVEINSDLLKKKFAYKAGGNVYFDISKFSKYGELSRFNPDQMKFISLERGNNLNDPNKKNPLDFVLWFGSTEDPNWESAFGPGRPGWHIECSAMINKYLGDTIDIHGGGRDLMYPHHDSEIVQSESFTGKKFVNTWMHTAIVLYEGEKMSKSLGNLVLVEDLLKKYSPDTIRWMILSHHYRSPWEYEEMELSEIEEKVKKIKKALGEKGEASSQKADLKQFEELMNDDLKTPEVLSLVENLARENRAEDAKKILEILGFKV